MRSASFTYDPSVWGNAEVMGLIMFALAILILIGLAVYIAGRKGV